MQRPSVFILRTFNGHTLRFGANLYFSAKFKTMTSPCIIVPTDFQEAAARAADQGAAIAVRLDRPLILLHISENESKAKDAEERAKAACAEVRRNHTVEVDYAVEPGELDDLAEIASAKHAQLMVIGSYGIRGLAQHLFGARMLRVLRNVRVPAVVVQSETPVSDRFRKILLPIDDIEPFDQKVKTVIACAKWFGSEVMLYALRHPMTDSKKVSEHVDITRKLLTEAGITYGETEESPKFFSAGIAKQALVFAESWGADLIAISLADPPVNAKLNRAECEQVINNKAQIAVLCTPEHLDDSRIFS